MAIASDSGGYLYGATWGDGVFRSVDDGLTWTHTGPGLASPWVRCVATRDTLEVFAGCWGQGRGLSRSTDAGDSWNLITGPLGNISVTALAIDFNGDILIATMEKEIYRSTDDGETWTMDTIWIPGAVQAPRSPGEQHLAGASTEWIFTFARREERMFAADTLGTFFRYSRPVSEVGFSGGSVPVSVRLHQNYPNPFNPSTSIEYTLPHSGYTTLRVYNILGEEVARLADGGHAAGSFKANWDATGLPSGVYFYRLIVGEHVQTMKAVLMK